MTRLPPHYAFFILIINVTILLIGICDVKDDLIVIINIGVWRKFSSEQKIISDNTKLTFERIFIVFT